MNDGVYRALLIGNAIFPEDPHNLNNLNGPLNDISLLRSALTDRKTGLFERGNVRVLKNQKKAVIASTIERFYQEAGRSDTTLLYYSGHGKSDERDNLYLCARDTRTTLLNSTGLSDIEIQRMMEASYARTFVIILDCCHAGGFKSGGIPTNLQGEGRFLLASSRRNELSLDAEDPSGNSAFTRYLVEGLRTGADRDGDGYVSLSEVYQHVLDGLERETQQRPQRHFDRTVGDVRLARVKVFPKRRPVAEHASSSKGHRILRVTPTEVDFGVVLRNSIRAARTVRIQTPGPDVAVTASTDVPWLDVTQHGGTVTVEIDTSTDGEYSGHLLLRSSAGDRVVDVRAIVEPGPLLRVRPKTLDFGRRRGRSATVRIDNAGSGDLKWKHRRSGDFFDVSRTPDGLVVTQPGSYSKARHGSIFVWSNGGNAEIAVQSAVTPRRERTSLATREPVLVQPRSRTREVTARERPRRARVEPLPVRTRRIAPSFELSEGEVQEASYAIRQFGAPGAFAVPPAHLDILALESRVLITNKRLVLVPKKMVVPELVPGLVVVSIPWTAVEAVDWQDTSQRTGRIFKVTHQAAIVRLRLRPTGLTGAAHDAAMAVLGRSERLNATLLISEPRIAQIMTTNIRTRTIRN